jgi:triosephosphate isomerase (TIM)
MSKKIIIGNWKLNPLTLAEAQDLAGKIERSPAHITVVCPPTAFLADIDYPNLGAQDCFWKVKGAYTGQTSPAALKSLGVKYCIVGHSERRALGETDLEINEKVLAVLEQGIIPVLCVGHGTTEDQDELAVTDIIKTQLEIALRGAEAAEVIVAYEPVWAIGRGKPASAEHAEKIGIFIKTKYGVDKVLYGGSTTSVNAHDYLSQPHIDGLLVGGASLLTDDFNKMINTEI